MAQIIDLGKLRYNWQGAYSSGTTYQYNDVVTYGPNVYAYIAATGAAGHTPSTETSYWALVIQGFELAGTYTNATHYYKNDLVTDGTSTYVVMAEHTATSSSVSPNSNLQVFALGQPGLPNQSGKANYLLTTNGSTTAWTNKLEFQSEFIGDQAGGTGSYGQLALNWAGSTQASPTTPVYTNVISAYAVSRSDNFAQLAIANLADGAQVSTDFITYTNDGTDNDGFMDMGITSRSYSQSNFGITGAHDGYIFMSAPRGTTYSIQSVSASNGYATMNIGTHPLVVGNKIQVEGLTESNRTVFNGPHTITAVTSTSVTFATTSGSLTTTTVTETADLFRQYGNGNLVFATDSTGLSNSIIFAAGGYSSGTTQMSILPNQTVNVAITTNSTSATTGALTIAGGVGIVGNTYTNGDVHIGGILYSGDSTATSWGATALLTAPAGVFEVTSSANTYGQIALHNKSTTSSSDFIAYPDNGNDADGWIDMGITGSQFTSTNYGITGPNDGYLFMDAPALGTPIGNGNLVLATGSNGLKNQIIFAAGGFQSGTTQMTITPNQSVNIAISTQSTSPTTGALVVNGGVGITGNVNIAGNITFGGSGTNVSTANLAVVAPFVFTGSGSLVSTNDLGLVTEGKYTVTNIPVATVINTQLTNNVATLTTLVAHSFAVNDSVTIASLNATYNGTYTITSVPTTTTFTYAKTNANLASTPIGQVNYTITTKSLTSNVATLTTSTTHAMTVGTIVFVSGVDATFNGIYTVTAITTNTFSYALTAANVNSTSATGTATYYTSASTATVSAATRTRWSAFTKHNTDGQWNLVSNISTIPTTGINYNQNTYGNGSDLVYEKVVIGGLTIQGSGSNYGAPYGSLVISGNISAPAWTTNGLRHVGSAAATLTDTTSSGTVAAAYINTFASNVTVAASNATTYTTYANSYFGAPIAGTNVTITNPYAIYAGGSVYATGTLTVAGTTTLSGSVNFNAASGTFAINTNKFTVDIATGNTSTAGTLTATGLATLNGGANITGAVTITGPLTVMEMREQVNSLTISANAVTFDYTTGNLFYIGTAAAANYTINLTNVPTTNGYITTAVVFQVQGSTGYYPSAMNINGSAATIRWAQGAAPLPTNGTNKIDIWSFTIIYLSGSYTVIGNVNYNY